MSLKNTYLIVYNVASMAAWAYVLFLTATHFQNGGHYSTLWDTVGVPLTWAQTAAVLEIVHALTGLVKSPVATVFIQVASRLFVLYFECHVSPTGRAHWGFALMTVSWCLVEVPRYLFYALKQVDNVPYWLTWLRYSLFIVLYPSGISGELLTGLFSMPDIISSGVYNVSLPNDLNLVFNFGYFMWFMLSLYIPGSPTMIGHMWAQRKKTLAAESAKAKVH